MDLLNSQLKMDIMNLVAMTSQAVTVLGLPILIGSIIVLVKQLRVQAYQAIYNSVLEIDKFLVQNPDLREYLYEGKALPEDRLERERVLAAADMLLTFFEHIVGQQKSVSKRKWKSLKSYLCDAFNSSPALQLFLAKKNHWFSNELKCLLEGKKWPVAKKQ